MKATTILTVYAILMLLGFVEAVGVSLEWAVIGDSWASGVAYNSSNVYKPTDNETCHRSKEAWGAQMEGDNSWSIDPQAFQFAACGGTLMDDLERQMKERAGQPDIVWGMFGGNNAFFGAIARACICQPISPEHPFGWGPPWDEDSDGTGLYFTKALNDIITVAQNTQALNQPFDLYVSSYVRFFDNNTDSCDEWSFAHDRLSTGKPKLVKEPRTIINDKVQHLNDIQAEVVKNYQIRPHTPFNPNFCVHNSQPDSIFNGHRFCEPNHTFEDQYCNQKVWLWNLQYYEEKTGEEVGVTTTKNSVKFMAPPAGLDVTQGFQTVLGADTSINASVPLENNANTQQYGFGWTARPFHPKFDGHTALKDFFIQQMRNDRIPGIKPAILPPPKSSPTPTPKPLEKLVCNGLGSSKYANRDIVKDSIQKSFCPDAVSNGPIQKSYNQGTPEEVIIKLLDPNGFKPSSEECIKYLLAAITDGCDGNKPQNPANYKGGGTETIGDIVYTIQPQALRQPAVKAVEYGCDSSYNKLQSTIQRIYGLGP